MVLAHAAMVVELVRREREKGITPDPVIQAFMEAAAIEVRKRRPWIPGVTCCSTLALAHLLHAAAVALSISACCRSMSLNSHLVLHGSCIKAVRILRLFLCLPCHAQGHPMSLNTDLMLRLLGLEVCADTIVGNVTMRGVSGGQRKRVTTGGCLAGVSWVGCFYRSERWWAVGEAVGACVPVRKLL